MFSSISQRIFGTTPHKNSSPGPTRPPRDEPMRQPFPSTAPPGMQEAARDLDRQFSEVSETWGQADPDNDDEDIPDGLPSEYDIKDDGDGDADDSDEYDDPFAGMAAFSTQIKPDEDDASAYGSDGDASAITKAEPEPSNKVEEKAPGRRTRQATRSEEHGSSAQTLPSPITSGLSNGSAAEEDSDSDASSSHRLPVKAEPPAPPVSNKKKRKHRSRSSQSASAEPEQSTRAKKRKVRKPLEDIEDDDMDTQPEETVPDSPSNQIAEENSQSPGLDHDDFDHDLTLDLPTKPEPQQSQLVSVSRQLFQPIKGTSTGPTSVSEDDEQDDIAADDVSDDDMSDANHEVSLSSPSVIAQRRRSMSRGSQISSFRQGLSRESTGMPDRISEAAESAEDESEGEDDQADPVVDAGGDVSMAETSALASGALRDDPDQDDFADQLPPSSQPPREDSPSEDGDAMDVDDEDEDADERSESAGSEEAPDSDAASNELEEAQKAEAGSDQDSDEEEEEPVVEQPELPTRSTRRNGTASTSNKAPKAPGATTPRAASRRSRLDSHLINMSELSHVPSSAQKSARSTGSRRQRSKPNFFEATEAYDHFDEEEKSENENNQENESGQDEETNQDEESDEEEENDEGSEEEVDEGTTVLPSSGTKTCVRNPASLRRSMRSTTASPQKQAAKPRAPKSAAKSAAAKSTTPKSKTSKPMPTGTPRSSAPSRAATASKGTTPLQRLARPTPLHTPSAHGEKMGRFDAEEHRRLDDLVQKYRKQKGWTQQKMNNTIQLRYRERQPDHGEDFNGQDFKDLWDFILPHFPDRSGTKVRSVARGRYDNSQKRAGSWTREEDERIEELLDKYRGSSSKWVYIGEEMNRNPNHVRDRYRNYIVCGQNPDGVSTYQKWTEEEEENLVDCVMTVLRRMVPADPRRRPTKPMDYVNWQVVSDEMERKRSRLQCAKKWKQLHIELGEDDYNFPEDSDVSWFLRKARLQVREMSAEERYAMVKSILDLAPGTDEAIPWQKVVNISYRQKWHRPTLKLLWSRLKQQVPGWAKKSVRDCARWLLEEAKKNTLPKSKILTGGNQEGEIAAEEKAIRLGKKPEPKRKATPKKKAPTKKAARSAEMVEESDTSEDEEVEGQDDETDDDTIRKKQPIKRVNRKAPPPKKSPRSAEMVEESDASEDEDANSQEADETNGDNNETDAEESDAEESKESSDEEIEEPVDEETEQEVEESEEASDDESQKNDEDTQSGAAQKQSRGISEQAALQLSFAPSLSLGASQQVGTQPSPAKKRIRLSKGLTVNSRVSEGDFEEDGETPEVSPSQSHSQLDVRKIPDRKTEKRLAARQRVSSGSRARSTASAQPEYVPNDKIDKDMPPIRVPPSTQPSRFQAINRPPQGNFARRTGSSVLPGEPVELTDEIMAEFEAADRAGDVTGSIMDSPIASARRSRRRRRDAEVGETP